MRKKSWCTVKNSYSEHTYSEFTAKEFSFPKVLDCITNISDIIDYVYNKSNLFDPGNLL